MSVHKDLTGADLHEPKGADTATAGKVYVSDGAGSGAWTAASSVITNTAFTTGDLKITHKATADTSWILWSEGTIGDSSSSSSIRADADTADLFALYWNNYSNSVCPVYTSGGVATTRGSTAVLDYAAHKRIGLPTGAGRHLAIAGTGPGLTVRALGASTGAETATLTRANLPNVTVTPTVSITDPGHVHSIDVGSSGGGSDQVTQGVAGIGATVAGPVNSATTGITATSSFALNGGVTQTTVSIIPPSSYVNVMIKL